MAEQKEDARAREVQIEIFRKMTAEQKLELSMRLYWSARRLKASWLRQQHADWTEEQVQKEVAKIFAKVRPCLHNGLPAVMPIAAMHSAREISDEDVDGYQSIG
jgi:hypothetical protein